MVDVGNNSQTRGSHDLLLVTEKDNYI